MKPLKEHISNTWLPRKIHMRLVLVKYLVIEIKGDTDAVVPYRI
jgi:hypothetical protein